MARGTSRIHRSQKLTALGRTLAFDDWHELTRAWPVISFFSVHEAYQPTIGHAKISRLLSFIMLDILFASGLFHIAAPFACFMCLPGLFLA